MLKAADALAEAGYDVRVVSTRYMDWAWEADQKAYARRSWKWSVVDYQRATNPRTYLWSGLRHKASQRIAGVLRTSRCPLSIAAWGFGRIHTELAKAAMAEPADLYYGGTTGGLAATAEVAKQRGCPFALDLEDFYSAERDESNPTSNLTHGLAERIERAILPRASFVTVGSQAIADAYSEKYGLCPVPINNTFPLPDLPPAIADGRHEGLHLYWFSQTIGPCRGLEDAILAMGLARIPGELHLRGRPVESYLRSLRQLSAERAPRLRIVHHEPAEPDKMLDLCHGHDVGLAIEPGFSRNNRLALSNKASTYMLGGLAIALTDTPGQRPVANDLGDAAIVYRPGDIGTLADRLKSWADSGAELSRAKQAAWEAARRRWHWEHPLERGQLLRLVECAVGDGAAVIPDSHVP